MRSTHSYPGNLYTSDHQTFVQPLAGCATIGDPVPSAVGRFIRLTAKYIFR